jgi:hypothetical protein
MRAGRAESSRILRHHVGSINHTDNLRLILLAIDKLSEHNAQLMASNPWQAGRMHREQEAEPEQAAK